MPADVGSALGALAFLERLRSNAYDSLNVTGHRVDTLGWTNPYGIRRALDPIMSGELGSTHVTVIEVGAWKGGSTHVIANAMKHSPALKGSKLHVVSVDTWLGAPEFWYRCCIDAPDRGGGLSKVDGYPSVYYTFARNMKALRHDDVSCPLPMSGREGALVLLHWGVRAAAVYVDEFGAAYDDLENYWPLLVPGGVLFGDDAKHPPVGRAVQLFQARHAHEISHAHNFSERGSVWIVRRALASAPGDRENKTRTYSSRDYEVVRRRIDRV